MIYRTVKRVPMDFDYPLNKVWYGYYLKPQLCLSKDDTNVCGQCMAFAKSIGIKQEEYGCPNLEEFFEDKLEAFLATCEPPEGEGYQLWETTSEGSPVSPVFATLEELCSWCETNYTIYGKVKAGKEEWLRYLKEYEN